MSDANNQLNLFDLYLPLPFRVVLLINFGILLWHINLITCLKYDINILLVLKISPTDITLKQLIANSRKRLFNVTISTCSGYLAYIFLTLSRLDFISMEWLPLFCIFIAFLILLRSNPSKDSNRLTETIKRVVRGNIDINLRNNDILLTDTLTSYNKVLVDFLVYVSALALGIQSIPKGTNLSKELTKNHLQIYNLDLLFANFPSLLRLKQCLIEYKSSNRRNSTHLFNAIKYSTAFLPTAAMILFKSGFIKGQTLWYFAMFINSTYSFYWDISNDWNFGFFSKFLSNKSNTVYLRNKLIYSRTFYIIAILIDFSLRYIWILKLLYLNSNSTSSLKVFSVMLFTTEMGNFILEILEIFRRWVWVFIKVETEYVKIVTSEEYIEMQNLD